MSSCIPDDALPVQINAFRTPASVWATEVVRGGMSEARLELYKLEQKLCAALNKNFKKYETATFREPDDLVAVRSKHDERQWHRGKIECRMELMSGPQYKVHLIDYGFTMRVKPNGMRNLPFRCDYVPPQALNLVLESIVPVNFTFSANLESFQSEMGSVWTPSAETFVETINKDHDGAYFVERGGYPQCGQTRYGDLLIIMKGRADPVSLTHLLCESRHAKYCREEFEKRQETVRSELDAPEMCWSPLPTDSSTDSCSPSPAQAMMSSLMSKNIKKEIPNMEASFKKIETQKISEAAMPSSPQDSTKICSGTERDESSSITKCSRQALLAKLKKKSNSNSSTPEKNFVRPPETPVETSLDIPTLQPQVLDSRFFPAGFIIKNEQKPKSERMRTSPLSTKTAFRSSSNGYCSSNVKSSDSDEVSFSKDANCAEPVSSEFGQRPAAQQNHRARPVHAEATFSDSSISDCSSHTNLEATHIVETLRSCSQSSNKSDNPDSSDSGLSANKSQMMIKNLSKLLSKRRSVLPGDVKPNGPPEPANKEIVPVKEASAKVPDFPIGDNPPSFLRNQILSTVIDDDMLSEDYLARSVLLHGGFRPKPWITSNELKSKFSNRIEKYLLEKHWYYNILTIQKFMWPAIQQRQNVVMISPKKSGKTTSYVIPLMDFMISSEETPKGNGPMVIILSSGSRAASKIYEECVRALSGLKKAPRVHVAYGLAIEKHTIINLINGCEVFVTTPPCLLRMLKDQKYAYSLNFHRLNHYVLDEADILMSRFLGQIKEIQAILVAEQNMRTKNCGEKDPIQIIVASEKWESRFLSFSEHLRGTPLLCINDCFEACVYGKPDVVFHLTQAENKPSKLLKVLRDIVGLQKVVLFCDETEVSKIAEFLNNECMNCLVVNPHAHLRQLEVTLSSWHSSKAGEHYVLVCADDEFEGLKIQDATCVVHYSLPPQDRSCFVKRLSSILASISNRFEGKMQKSDNERPHHLVPSIHLLMDESNSDQLPVIVQLMQRISDKLEKKLLETAEAITMKKEKKNKINKLFCQNLKMYGQCWKMSDCPNRHVFIPEFDVCEDLPSSGVVSMQVTQVHSAGHYSVRLIEHIQDKTLKEWPSQYLKVGVMMFDYFSKQENKILIAEINIGDIFCVETDEGLYQRVQILDILENDRYGKPSSVQVQFLDEGHQTSVKVYMLHLLPEHLKAIPAQVVDVYLCGLLPADQDSDYGRDANACVRKWTKCADEDKEKRLQGKIIMSMTGSLWIEPMNVLEWLPVTQMYVVRQNIREGLLQERHALENPQHMPKLFKLCGKDASVLSSNTATLKYLEPKTQPQPEWAFLESDDEFEDVEFICAVDVSLFFVRRKKFDTLLKNLIDDIDKNAPPRKHEEVLQLTLGSVCLSTHIDEPKWHRVKIISENENGSFTVFYVDHGDTLDVSIEALKCIPDWAITRLPFQAIECSLAGVSCCDTVDKLYDITESGAKDLAAKVCERRKDAKLTGGSHFVIVVVDCSKSSILNKDLLTMEGVEPCEDQLKFLNFQVESSLFNRLSEVDQDTELNLSDMEYEEDLSGFVDSDTDDGMGDFEVFGLEDMVNDFKKNNPAVIEKAMADIKNKTQSEQKQLDQAVPGSFDLHCNENTITADIDAQHINIKEDLSDWEDESEFVGRSSLPVLCTARPPTTKWLEDLYYIWIKICVVGVETYFLKWTHNSIQFSTTVRGRHYHFNQQLRGMVFPDSIKSSMKGFHVEVKMKKVYSGVLWGRLFLSRRKFPWVSRDLEADVQGSSDTDGEGPLGAVNREIRKIPLKQRRRRRGKHMKGKIIKPDMCSDSENSDYDGEMIDSDEMF